MTEIVVLYLLIGVWMAAISDALVDKVNGWDIPDRPDSITTNPGPFMRAVIVLFWPLAIVMFAFWLFDKTVKALAHLVRRIIQRGGG